MAFAGVIRPLARRLAAIQCPRCAQGRQRMDVVRVGMVGGGFMGRVYSLALGAVAGLASPHLPRIVRSRFVDVSPEVGQAMQAAWGWHAVGTDWAEVTRDPAIDLVLVLTPNDSHAEIAIDALEHGKHVVCEKPLSNTLEGARAMYSTAAGSGRTHHVGFVYRMWPAAQVAREMIGSGEIGEVVHYRGRYFHDYGLDQDMPFTWRLDKERSGGGSGADIGSHVIDMARFLTGREVDRVCASQRTHFTERPVAGRPNERRRVEVDEITDMLVEFEGGLPGVLQTSWLAGGHKVDLAFAVHGTRGSVEFSSEQPTELKLYRTSDPARESGFKSVPIGPAHTGFDLFWPVAGMALSFADGFVILIRDVLQALATGRSAAPSFLDGLRATEVVVASQTAARARAWVEVQRAAP
jgi:predicted dehydrogenase